MKIKTMAMMVFLLMATACVFEQPTDADIRDTGAQNTSAIFVENGCGCY